MWTNNKKAISEVNAILKQLKEDSIKKVPRELLTEIEKNASENVDYIKPNIALEDLKLEEETKEMLAVISYSYFCNEQERKSWEKELAENEKQYQEELAKKYNPNHLFQSNEVVKQENSSKQQENALIEYKEPFFKKIWDKIKKFFKFTK